MAHVLNGFTAWPQANGGMMTTEEVVKAYSEGYAGAFQEPEVSEEVNEIIERRGGTVDGNDLATAMGFAGDGAGQLTILFPAVVQSYGYKALTKPGQKTGDCVSMAGRDVSLHLVCLEAISKIVDEVTGKIEAVPVVSETAARNGVFCNEGIYLHRGHNGQGMSCSQGVKWITTEGGVIIRAKYPEADLEEYNVSFETRGKSGSPQWMDDIAKQHPIRDVTRPQDEEGARDFIARGKPIWCCSGLGWSSKRDANGYAKKSGSWSHSWHVVGYDDRAETIKEYGFPLALLGHRWAVWNSGGREIRDSAGLVPAELRETFKALGMLADSGNVLIPEGYWWADARLLRKCDMYAVSGAAGWETSSLPDYLGGFK